MTFDEAKSLSDLLNAYFHENADSEKGRFESMLIHNMTTKGICSECFKKVDRDLGY